MCFRSTTSASGRAGASRTARSTCRGRRSCWPSASAGGPTARSRAGTCGAPSSAPATPRRTGSARPRSAASAPAPTDQRPRERLLTALSGGKIGPLRSRPDMEEPPMKEFTLQTATQEPGLGTAMEVVYQWNYDVEVDELRSLYVKAAEAQWIAGRDLAWERPIDLMKFSTTPLGTGIPI